ncbi:hypothetical protein MBAV_005021 [Candidatus Magnetobacterium bavaricum]|uniref:Uncharacterized protein n=1 Tax=Candidatus Magnetobacterium bavaricum TaxID=29290 RepID=A0A0F3GLK6_9BACT|nr:hypothetical protein MBAV_005021 [Candidatus Magnetobacterium bavaricum]
MTGCGILPEDAGLAVAVEVGNAQGLPRRGTHPHGLHTGEPLAIQEPDHHLAGNAVVPEDLILAGAI